MAQPYGEVIGDPVSHSKSPLIHRRWLDALGIAGDYRRTQVSAEELASFFAKRRGDPDWRGCNVTVPNKQAVMPHLDRLDSQAEAIGAVNTIVPTSEGLVGYNTDVDGVASALDRVSLAGATVALVGAGGAARAAVVYLASRAVRELNILARDPAKAGPLGELLPNSTANAARFDAAGELFPGTAVIINASPLGMSGFPPMPANILGAAGAARTATLFDMVYQPLETEFLKAAPGPAIDGLTMLAGQAARAFELFFGAVPPPPDEALFAALAA